MRALLAVRPSSSSSTTGALPYLNAGAQLSTPHLLLSCTVLGFIIIVFTTGATSILRHHHSRGRHEAQGTSGLLSYRVALRNSGQLVFRDGFSLLTRFLWCFEAQSSSPRLADSDILGARRDVKT